MELRSEVLAKLLVMQSVIGLLPDENKIYSFLCRGLEDVPGIEKVLYTKGDITSEAHQLFPLKTADYFYGAIAIAVGNPQQFEPYKDFIKNLCFMVAVILEERRLRRLNAEHQKDLERRVQERTQQLTDSNKRFQVLFDQAAVGVAIIISETGQFISVNKKYCDIVGYSREEMEKLTFQNITHPDDLQEDLDNMQKLLKGEISEFAMEKRYFHKNGSTVWVNLTVSPMWKTGHKPAYHIAVVEDITMRKRAEKDVIESRLLTDNLIETAKVMIIGLDSSGSITIFNRAAEQITGYKKSELEGKNWFETLVPKARYPYVWDEFNRLMDGGMPGVLENPIVTKSGEERYISWTNNEMRDGGKILGTISFGADITEYRKMEEELQRVHKLESVGILAGGIAHDFNNLLTAIMNNLYLAENKLKIKDNVYEHLKRAEKALEMAVGLTHQLLTFSHGGSPVKEASSLAELVKGSADFSVRGSNVRLQYDIPDSIWQVHIDRGQISQVVQNLIINADQSMPDGGVISIAITNDDVSEMHMVPLRPGRYVKMLISDQGKGIPQKYLQKIFDPFFTTKSSGKGLGLAVSHSIIDKHGGHITVESRVGAGTTFTLYLPASTEVSSASSTGEDVLLEGKGKILVMDDEEMVRESLKALLISGGYEVDCVENGDIAVERYKQTAAASCKYDAVILDLTVPGGKGGAEAMRELLRFDPEAKAIVSSGYATEHIMSKYSKYGFKAILKKPYNPHELFKVVHDIIGCSQ